MLTGLSDIDLTAADAIDKINALAKTLTDTNTELVGKNKSLATASGNQSAATAEELEALRVFKSNADVAAAESLQSYSDAKALTAQAHTDEMGKLTEQVKAFQLGEQERLINDGIRSELKAAGINPLIEDSAMALFKNQSKVVDGKAMIGDKPQGEAIQEWLLTDSGKASCVAQESSNGGGYGGSKDGQDHETVNKQAEEAKSKGDLAGFLSATMAQQPTE